MSATEREALEKLVAAAKPYIENAAPHEQLFNGEDYRNFHALHDAVRIAKALAAAREEPETRENEPRQWILRSATAEQIREMLLHYEELMIVEDGEEIPAKGSLVRVTGCNEAGQPLKPLEGRVFGVEMRTSPPVVHVVAAGKTHLITNLGFGATLEVLDA